MAIRERKGRASPWQCYWNNPLTGKRECANFATRHEAEKHDSLIKHRLKFDRESFKVEESEETPAQELTLEGAYLLYLREKQFNKKSLQWQMDAMRLPLRKMGDIPLDAITAEQIANLMEEHGKRVVKAATIHNRMSVLCSVLRWCMSNGFMPELRFPKLPPKRYEHFIPPTPDELCAIMDAASPPYHQGHCAGSAMRGSRRAKRTFPSDMGGCGSLARSAARAWGQKESQHPLAGSANSGKSAVAL